MLREVLVMNNLNPQAFRALMAGKYYLDCNIECWICSQVEQVSAAT
jgi:hypothetical protein